MTAFPCLEELYAGYNEIEEIYDIQFLTQLRVLDFEGNNCKKMDEFSILQMFCLHLEDVNFKFNPIAKELTYYNKMQESFPRLKFLDDEQVDAIPNFFESKIKQMKQHKLKLEMDFQKLQEVDGSEVLKRFI